MSDNLVWKIDAGSKVELQDYDPDYIDAHTDRTSADQELMKLSDELSDLQEALAAAQHQSLLVILQGMDTSGKDGTIRHVLSHVNPQGCLVHSLTRATQAAQRGAMIVQERSFAYNFRVALPRVRAGGG